MWPKSTQVEIQNDGGSLGLVISLKTRSHLPHLIESESLMFSLKQYCLDFPIFTMIHGKFHFSPTFTSKLFLFFDHMSQSFTSFRKFCFDFLAVISIAFKDQEITIMI